MAIAAFAVYFFHRLTKGRTDMRIILWLTLFLAAFCAAGAVSGSASPFLRSRTGARTSSTASIPPVFRLRFNRSPATRSSIRSQLITPIIRCRAEDMPPPNSSTARMRKASAASSGNRIRRISASPSSRSPESRWRSCCSAMSSAKAPGAAARFKDGSLLFHRRNRAHPAAVPAESAD